MNKEISIFDFDSTLVFPPTFASMLEKNDKGVIQIQGKFEGYFNKIKSFFYIVFAKEVYFIVHGERIILYDFQTKKPLSIEVYEFLQNLEPVKMRETYNLKAQDLKLMWRSLSKFAGTIEVEPANDFHSHPETIGDKINPEVLKLYHDAKNKMILTGRKESLRTDLEKKLVALGINHPNFGLYMFPGTQGISIMQYKTNAILTSIAQNNWTIVNFYEDDLDWLTAAQRAVSEKYPEVIFTAHHIS